VIDAATAILLISFQRLSPPCALTACCNRSFIRFPIPKVWRLRWSGIRPIQVTLLNSAFTRQERLSDKRLSAELVFIR
jgi:hypothetical protein